MIYKFTENPDGVNWYRLDRFSRQKNVYLGDAVKHYYNSVSLKNSESIYLDHYYATESELTFEEVDENQLILREIAEYDYERMFKNTTVFREELIAKAFHPSRVIKWIELGYDPTEL